MEFQFLTDLMDQLDNVKILEKFLKEKKWLEDLVIKKYYAKPKGFKVDKENNLLIVKGAVPGHKGSILRFLMQ